MNRLERHTQLAQPSSSFSPTDWLQHVLGDLYDQWQEIGVTHGCIDNGEIIRFLIQHYKKTVKQPGSPAFCSNCCASPNHLCSQCKCGPLSATSSTLPSDSPVQNTEATAQLTQEGETQEIVEFFQHPTGESGRSDSHNSESLAPLIPTARSTKLSEDFRRGKLTKTSSSFTASEANKLGPSSTVTGADKSPTQKDKSAHDASLTTESLGSDRHKDFSQLSPRKRQNSESPIYVINNLSFLDEEDSEDSSFLEEEGGNDYLGTELHTPDPREQPLDKDSLQGKSLTDGQEATCVAEDNITQNDARTRSDVIDDGKKNAVTQEIVSVLNCDADSRSNNRTCSSFLSDPLRGNGAKQVKAPPSFSTCETNRLSPEPTVTVSDKVQVPKDKTVSSVSPAEERKGDDKREFSRPSPRKCLPSESPIYVVNSFSFSDELDNEDIGDSSLLENEGPADYLGVELHTPNPTDLPPENGCITPNDTGEDITAHNDVADSQDNISQDSATQDKVAIYSDASHKSIIQNDVTDDVTTYNVSEVSQNSIAQDDVSDDVISHPYVSQDRLTQNDATSHPDAIQDGMPHIGVAGNGVIQTDVREESSSHADAGYIVTDDAIAVPGIRVNSITLDGASDHARTHHDISQNGTTQDDTTHSDLSGNAINADYMTENSVTHTETRKDGVSSADVNVGVTVDYVTPQGAISQNILTGSDVIEKDITKNARDVTAPNTVKEGVTSNSYSTLNPCTPDSLFLVHDSDRNRAPKEAVSNETVNTLTATENVNQSSDFTSVNTTQSGSVNPLCHTTPSVQLRSCVAKRVGTSDITHPSSQVSCMTIPANTLITFNSGEVLGSFPEPIILLSTLPTTETTQPCNTGTKKRRYRKSANSTRSTRRKTPKQNTPDFQGEKPAPCKRKRASTAVKEPGRQAKLKPSDPLNKQNGPTAFLPTISLVPCVSLEDVASLPPGWKLSPEALTSANKRSSGQPQVKDVSVTLTRLPAELQSNVAPFQHQYVGGDSDCASHTKQSAIQGERAVHPSTLPSEGRATNSGKTFIDPSIFSTTPKRKVLPENPTSVKPFICHTCGKGFNFAANLQKHNLVHTGAKPFKCKLCGKCFSQSAHLKLHQRSHTGEKPFLCSVCGASFIQAGGLKVHMGIHSGERPFGCDFCEARFLRLGDLNKHSLKHTKHRPFSCQHCQATFASSSSCHAHMRTHTGVKPYKCVLCEAAFTHSISLTSHVKSKHSGERPYKCEECGQAFTWSTDLRKHQRIHTNERPYKCCECNAAFTRTDHLKVHMRKHTGERPFVCEICGQTYTRQEGVVNHKKKMHAALIAEK